MVKLDDAPFWTKKFTSATTSRGHSPAGTQLQVYNPPGHQYLTSLETPMQTLPRWDDKISVTEWAKKVERVLGYKGYRDLTDPALFGIYMPAIAKIVPERYLRLVKGNNLETVLDTLKHCEKKDEGTYVLMNKKRKLKRPSDMFDEILHDVQVSLDFDDESAKKLAFIILKTHIPWGLQMFCDYSLVRGYPTAEQFMSLDSKYQIWAAGNNDSQVSFTNAVTAQVEDTESGKDRMKITQLIKDLDRVKKGIKCIEAVNAVDEASNQPSSSKTQQPAQQQPVQNQVRAQPFQNQNFVRGGRGRTFRSRFPRQNSTGMDQLGVRFANMFGPNAQNTGEQQGNPRSRYPPPLYPHKENYCFFHRIHGDRSWNCIPPCDFFKEHPNAPQDGVNIRVPQETPPQQGVTPGVRRGFNNNALSEN